MAPAHFLTGYVRTEVEAVSEQLRRAVRDADLRTVLDDPDRVVASVQRRVATGDPLQLGEPAREAQERG